MVKHDIVDEEGVHSTVPFAASSCVFRGDRASLHDGGEGNMLAEELADEVAMREESPIGPRSNWQKDKWNMTLLVILYMIQGVPLGLTFGSVPYLLQRRLSYTEIGIFSFAQYPYSLKLLWSPIVDAIYWKDFGRRKSWIVPIQLCSAVLLFYLGTVIDAALDEGTINVWSITVLFFFLVMMAATQDIAVDGWAISILRKENRSFASTCQTIGLNAGYFISFTVFLALNSSEFANTYIRSEADQSEAGLLELGAYLQFWALVYVVVTGLIVLLKTERTFEPEDESDMSVTGVYKKIGEMLKLRNIQDLIFVLFVCKIGFAVADNVVALALLDRGFKKEDLAMFVLIDFPLQIVYAVVSGRLAAGRKPLAPWLAAYQGRLLLAALSIVLVYFFPTGPMTTTYYTMVLLLTLTSSFVSTIMFVSQGSFFARISDSSIGGTYLTLLNTISNLGGTWPKFFVLTMVDWFTVKHCVAASGEVIPRACGTKAERVLCAEEGGACSTESDGIYVVGTICFLVGATLFVAIRSRIMRLERQRESSWALAKAESQVTDVGERHVM